MSESPPSATPANAVGHDPLQAPVKEPLEDRLQGRRAALLDDPTSGCPAIPVAKGLVRTHLAILTLAAFVYCFLCYCILRALLADFGLSAGTVLKAAIATAAMGGFVVWLVPLAELPEIVFGHALPQRRARRGRCPACNYDLQGRRGVRCPECGHDGSIPGTWHLSWRTARRFLLLLAAGLGLGVLAGEAWTTTDERAFLAEAQTYESKAQAMLDAFGPFDEHILVRRTPTDESSRIRGTSQAFAWIVEPGEPRPVPAAGVRVSSATRPIVLDVHRTPIATTVQGHAHVWSWSSPWRPTDAFCHLDLRYLPARSDFVLSIGSHAIRGRVIDDSFSPAREPGTATVVADREVLVRPWPRSSNAPEVVVHEFPIEWTRARAWPASFASMRYTPEHGIEVIDPFHSPRVVDWSPRRDRASARIDR
jgi:hypothetical protein